MFRMLEEEGQLECRRKKDDQNVEKEGWSKCRKINPPLIRMQKEDRMIRPQN